MMVRETILIDFVDGDVCIDGFDANPVTYSTPTGGYVGVTGYTGATGAIFTFNMSTGYYRPISKPCAPRQMSRQLRTMCRR